MRGPGVGVLAAAEQRGRPVLTYPHPANCAGAPFCGAGIIGGYVMHDPRLPSLNGCYVFGDLSTPALRVVRLAQPAATRSRSARPADSQPVELRRGRSRSRVRRRHRQRGRIPPRSRRQCRHRPDVPAGSGSGAARPAQGPGRRPWARRRVLLRQYASAQAASAEAHGAEALAGRVPRGASSGRSVHRTSRRGTLVSFHLSERATVTFAVQRARTARRGWRTVRGSFHVIRGRGTRRLRFTGRIGGQALAEGRYRLVARARTDTSRLSGPVRARFQIDR